MPAQHKHGGGDGHEGKVPECVHDDDGLRVGPVGAALLEVVGGSLADEHRGLSHQAAAAGAAEQSGGFVEGAAAAAGGGGGNQGGAGGGW